MSHPCTLNTEVPFRIIRIGTKATKQQSKDQKNNKVTGKRLILLQVSGELVIMFQSNA